MSKDIDQRIAALEKQINILVQNSSGGAKECGPCDVHAQSLVRFNESANASAAEAQRSFVAKMYGVPNVPSQ